MSQDSRPRLREGGFQIAMILGRKKLTGKNLWKRKIYLGGWVDGLAPSAEGVLGREVRLRCWKLDFALRVQHNPSAGNYMQMLPHVKEPKFEADAAAMDGRLLTIVERQPRISPRAAGGLVGMTSCSERAKLSERQHDDFQGRFFDCVDRFTNNCAQNDRFLQHAFHCGGV